MVVDEETECTFFIEQGRAKFEMEEGLEIIFYDYDILGEKEPQQLISTGEYLDWTDITGYTPFRLFKMINKNDHESNVRFSIYNYGNSEYVDRVSNEGTLLLNFVLFSLISFF